MQRRWESIFANTDDKIEHAATSASQQPLQGLYMYGGVGVGKTMLMDLLVESSPREFKLTRIHFHDFMLDVHSQLAKQKHQSVRCPLLCSAAQIPIFFVRLLFSFCLSGHSFKWSLSTMFSVTV